MRSTRTSNASKNDAPVKVKQIVEIAGEWGLWQTNIALFCTSVAMFSSFNGMASNFYQPATDFRCNDQQFVSIDANVCLL